MQTSPDPKQPKPADNSLASKGTTDTQSADSDAGTNLPRPESALAAAPNSEENMPASETEAASETPTDATASDTDLDTGGDSDPSASNTGHDEPL
ncbi:hypothetical protein [Hymenobacter tenuis]